MYFGVGRLLIGSALLYGGPIGYPHHCILAKSPREYLSWYNLAPRPTLPPSPASKLDRRHYKEY
jgi:hypothetical protein